MEHIDHTSLQELLALDTSPKITAYIPMMTSASPPHISENQIRFKNNINKAMDKLQDSDEGIMIAKEMKELSDRLHDDIEFWEHQTPGMLLCAAPGMTRLFHLPIDTEEYVAMDETFHLAPVISLVNDQREFYVLSIAQHNPALFKGDMYGLTRTSVEFPENAAVALNIDEPNQNNESQGSASGPSIGSNWFNGRGGSRDPKDQDRVRFFRIINKIVMENLNRGESLILAGVDSDVAEFRMYTKHPTILEESISGNQKDTPLHELFEKAYRIVWNELIAPEHQAALEEYHEMHGVNPNRTAESDTAVYEAAEQGRVDKLLAMFSRQTTDTIQDNAIPSLRITFPEPEISKNMNRLATKVYQMSGKVFNLLPNEMPSKSLVVARLRY